MVVPAVMLCYIVFQECEASYLSAKGSNLYNDKGEVVRLTGVNWFGFETTNMFPHGLWARDYHGVLKQVRDMGFNCIRIPFCNQMLRDDATPDKPNFYGEDPWHLRPKTDFNKELAELSPLEMMDEIIRYAGVLGLVVILDNHSREHDGYMNEKIWYTDVTPEQVWMDDWVMLAERYKNNPAVIGFDLNNEPHGKTDANGATWGAGNGASDWNEAAQKCGNAILAVNPDLLILIEGVEQYGESVYWWGGNLRGVREHPIQLSHPDKLVYSPHEYGPEVHQQPWFFEDGFPGNMEAIWDDAFGFLAKENTAPLLIGEFGISSMDSYEGKAGQWFETFTAYMDKTGISFTFWALNPNSGDTGGILSNDWVTPVQWKLDAISSLFAPLINEPSGVDKPSVNHCPANGINVYRSGNFLKYTGGGKNTFISLVDLKGNVVRTTDGKSLFLNGIVPGIYMVRLSGAGITSFAEKVLVP